MSILGGWWGPDLCGAWKTRGVNGESLPMHLHSVTCPRAAEGWGWPECHRAVSEQAHGGPLGLAVMGKGPCLRSFLVLSNTEFLLGYEYFQPVELMLLDVCLFYCR